LNGVSISPTAWLFIVLFVIGGWFQIRALGVQDKKTRVIFWALTGVTWLVLLVLGNLPIFLKSHQG
jgi:hypothetical protein